MRIAFFGLPLAALLLARDGHDIVYAGVCRKGAIGTRRLRGVARRVDIVPDAASEAVQKRVRAASADLVVSWFWTKLLPAPVLTAAPLGAIGVHPSLLPRHRGPDPYFWAIAAGDAQTGVTAHTLAEQYDTGEILAQTTLAIDPEWSALTLARRLDRPSIALLREVVASAARGSLPERRPQDEAAATQAPDPTDDDLAIDWRKPSETIVRLVRAASPWPGAAFSLGDDVLVVTRARVAASYPRVLEPGEAAVRSDGMAVVRTADGAVELIAGRDERDEPLDGRGFAERVRRAGEASA